MSQENELPINTSDWWKVYGSPSAQPGSVSVEELTGWFSTKTPGKDFLIVDVRRSDCDSVIPSAINLPSHSFPATLPTLLPYLSSIPKVIFHCNSSKGRGPRTAGWFADALMQRHIRDGASQQEAEKSVQEQALILTGGIVAWAEKHGKADLKNRGEKWDGKSLSTIPL